MPWGCGRWLGELWDEWCEERWAGDPCEERWPGEECGEGWWMGDLCGAGRWPGEACRTSSSSERRAGVVLTKERGSEDAMGLEDSLMYWKLLGRSGGVEEFLEVGGVEDRGRWSLRGRVDDLGDQLGVAIHHCSTWGF